MCGVSVIKSVLQCLLAQSMRSDKMAPETTSGGIGGQSGAALDGAGGRLPRFGHLHS